jgi:hypothetical protein
MQDTYRYQEVQHEVDTEYQNKNQHATTLRTTTTYLTIGIDDHLLEHRTGLREAKSARLLVMPAAFDHLTKGWRCGRELLVLCLLGDHQTSTVQHELDDLR